MSNSDLQSAQNIMLDVLVRVADICEKHKLTYWLDGGTLLGSIRHKGFIPWDDDIDIAMPRRDYEKFIKIAEKELPSDLFLQSVDKEKDYSLPWIKIRKNNTLLIETGETGEENYHHGIFIDIFPCDYYNSKSFLKWMYWTRTIRDKKKLFKKGSFKRSIVTFYTNVILGIPVLFSNIIYKRTIKRKKYWNNENGKYITYGLECFPPCLTKTTDFFPTKIVDEIFEGRSFRLPNKPEQVLRALYGDDFMKIPPKEKQKVHAKKIEF